MDEIESDPVDEQDDLATEAAFAAAIAAEFANAPNFGPGDILDRIEDILTATIGLTLRSYIKRVLSRMISGLDFQMIPGPRETDKIAEEVMADVIRDVAETIVYVIRENVPLPRRVPQSEYVPYGEPVVTPGLPEVRVVSNPEGDKNYVREISPSGDEETYRRVGLALRTASRLTATRAREEAKAGMARRLGATGSVWRTRKDSRVRVSHADLEGEFQPIDGFYVTISNARLRFPGDPLAPIGETINCRCRLSYRIPVGR